MIKLADRLLEQSTASESPLEKDQCRQVLLRVLEAFRKGVKDAADFQDIRLKLLRQVAGVFRAGAAFS